MAPNDAPQLRPPDQRQDSGDSRGDIPVEFVNEGNTLSYRFEGLDDAKDLDGIVEPGGKAVHQHSLSVSIEQPPPFDSPGPIKPASTVIETYLKDGRDSSGGAEGDEESKGDSTTFCVEGRGTDENCPQELRIDSEVPIDLDKVVPLPTGDLEPLEHVIAVTDSQDLPHHLDSDDRGPGCSDKNTLVNEYAKEEDTPREGPLGCRNAGNMEEAKVLESEVVDLQRVSPAALEKDCEPPSVTPNLPKPPSSPAAFNSTDFPSPPKDTEKEAELSWAARRAKDRKEHEELIESDRKSLDLLPVGDPTQVDVLLRLSAHLLDNYWAPDRMGCLQESISYIHDALALCRAGHPLRSSCLRKLADALCARCRRSYQIVDVVDAIKYCREDLVLCPAGHAERADSLEGLADALTLHQMRSGSGDEFEEIIKCHLEILTLRPSDRFHSRRNLLSMLHLRLDHSGDLDELINFTHVNLDLLLDQTDGDTPPRRDISVMYQFQSNKLHGDYLPDGKETRLEHAIECARKALDLRPVGDPGRDEVLCDLSRHLEKRYKLCSRKEDLEESITHAQEALALRPVGHNGRASALTILATALHSSLEGLADTLTLQQQQHSGSGDEFEEIIKCRLEILTLPPVRPFGLSEARDDLLSMLHLRLDHSGDLEELVSFTHVNLDLLLDQTDSDTPPRRDISVAYQFQGNELHDGYLPDGNETRLEHAIECGRKALDLRPVGDPGRDEVLCDLSRHLEKRYKLYGRKEDLEESITHAQEALALRPAGHNNRAYALTILATALYSSLEGLANALTLQQQYSGSGDEFEETIKCLVEILTLRPSDRFYPRRHLLSTLHLQLDHSGDLEELVNFTHVNLDLLLDQTDGDTPPRRDISVAYQYQSHNLLDEYSPPSKESRLEHAIECARKALDLRPEGDPGRDEVLFDLSCHLKKCYKLCSRKEDLEESITHAQEALALRPTGHDNRASTLTILAIALLSRYMADPGQSGDFEEAIGHHSEALGLHPVGHPERWTALRHLANAFEARYDHSGSMNDLESAIQYGAQVGWLRFIDDQSESAESRRKLANEYSHHARRLFDRFKDKREVRDREHAIECDRKALDLRPDGESGRDEVLFDLNRHLYEYCVHSQRNDYLNEAITHGRAALALRPSSHVYHLPTLINLTLALKLRWETSPSQLDDLEEAIAMLCKYLNLPSIDPVNRIKAFFRLSDLSNSRRLHAGSMEDLEAVRSGGEALSPYPHHSLRAPMLTGNNFTFLLPRWFGAGIGQLHDVEQANQFAQEVLDTIPSVQQKYHFYHELAAVLRDRYYHEGQLAALEDSIKYFRLCLGLLHEHDDKRSHVLTNLSRVLRSRFRHSSQIEDLKEMVRYAREALNLHPVGHSRRSSSLNGLASALEKYQRYDGTSSLDEVIQLRLASLDLIPPRDGRRGNILNGLGCTFQTRYDSSKKMHDLNEAIDYHNDALSFFNNQNSSRAGVLADIAVALRCRYQGVTDEDDLKMGIERLREARTCLPDGHQRTAWVLRELAVMLLTGKEPPTAHHADEAFTLLADAAHHKAASSRQQLNAAREWISRAVHHHHHSALDAYTCALALLHKCLATRPDVTAQQEFLGAKGKSLACDAAAFAIKEGKVEMALEMLEHGRTILWSKLRGYRESLHVLADADPSLCTHFEDVSAKLEHITTVIDSDSDSLSLEQEDIHADPSTAWDTRMRDHCLLSEEWDDVVDRIRKLHGFEDFLKAVPYATLRQVAIESVVVVINISKHRSDALILQGSNPPAVVCLPKATPKYLKRLSAKLFRAVESDDTDRQKRILPVLRGLWHNVMFPIHNQLASLGVPEMAHIWLCPTSVLCGLPLHAAGSYMPRVRNLPDLYVCSYTPTLSALITARSGLAEPLCSPQLLAVCQPADDLRRADEEIQCVEALGSFVVTLFGAEATPESVLSQLQEHQWTHFACHGHRDEDPFKSFLRLHGRNLTVREMMTARLPNAEFAFLSACHTAAVDTEGALDEVIHITSALQFAGFRSVVGTLWQAPDDIGPDLAKEFYQHMFHRSDGPADFRDAAKALSLATRAMRQKGVSLDRWIQYVHIGA